MGDDYMIWDASVQRPCTFKQGMLSTFRNSGPFKVSVSRHPKPLVTFENLWLGFLKDPKGVYCTHPIVFQKDLGCFEYLKPSLNDQGRMKPCLTSKLFLCNWWVKSIVLLVNASRFDLEQLNWQMWSSKMLFSVFRINYTLLIHFYSLPNAPFPNHLPLYKL